MSSHHLIVELPQLEAYSREQSRCPFQISDVNIIRPKVEYWPQEKKVSSAHDKPQLLSAAKSDIDAHLRPPPNHGRIIMSQNSGLGLLSANRASWHATGYCV